MIGVIIGIEQYLVIIMGMVDIILESGIIKLVLLMKLLVILKVL
mgnify:CR=1 FL=1